VLTTFISPTHLRCCRRTREQQEQELRAAREAALALPNPYAYAKPGHYSTAADDYLDALSGRANPARDTRYSNTLSCMLLLVLLNPSALHAVVNVVS
jgi:hypothetical protein